LMDIKHPRADEQWVFCHQALKIRGKNRHQGQ
jgi:hypothetical protein